jgi:hypothetical protein
MFKRVTEALNQGDDDTDLVSDETDTSGEYTEDSLCAFCGTPLDGAAFQCIKCNLLTCSSCICRDASCPACVGSGKPDLPEF